MVVVVAVVEADLDFEDFEEKKPMSVSAGCICTDIIVVEIKGKVVGPCGGALTVRKYRHVLFSEQLRYSMSCRCSSTSEMLMFENTSILIRDQTDDVQERLKVEYNP